MVIIKLEFITQKGSYIIPPPPPKKKKFGITFLRINAWELKK